MASPKTASERLAVLEGGGPTTEQLVSVVRADKTVIGESTFENRHIEFEATNVRRERSGIHARVEISADSASLAYSVFNIERDEDRTRLAGSAARRIGDPKRYTEPLKLRLNQFCAQVWPEWTRGDNGSWDKGLDRKTRWLIEPFMLAGAGTILYGPPSTAKSWITMLWALGVSHGAGPWPIGEQGPVMLVNLERPAALVQVRIRETARVISAPEKLLTLHARGRSLSDITEAIAQTVESEGCLGVVVDSLSRSGTGDLTANDAANRAMDLLNGIGCAWCVIAHTPRADSSHLFGSVMFEAAADLCVRVASSESSAVAGRYSIGVKLETTKANDVRKGKPELWALDFGDGDEGLLDLRKPSPGEFVDLEIAAMTLEDRIADTLRAGALTTTQIAEEIAAERVIVGATCRRSKRIVRVGDSSGGRGRSTRWGLKSDQDSE